MAKIFSVNFNKSYNDKYGATATLGSTSKIRGDEKGKSLVMNSNSTEPITYGDISAINAIGTGEFSFVVAGNIKSYLNHGSTFNSIAGKGNTNTSGFSISLVANQNTLRAYILTSFVEYYNTNILNKNNIYILTRNSSGLCSLYVNGISVGTPTTQTGSISTSTSLMSIGYDGNTIVRTCNANIYLSEMYNHCLSTVEIQKISSEFLAQTPISKPKRAYIENKATDLSKDVNNTVGVNLIGPLDFINGWTANASTINNSSTFTTSAGAGGVFTSYFLVAGKRYRVHIEGTTTSPSFSIFQGVSGGTRIKLSGDITGTFSSSLDFTASAVAELNFYLRNSDSGVTTINNFTVTELTGLIAAYNMQPVNGVITDISGSGNNLTVSSGLVRTKDGLQFQGKDTQIASTSNLILKESEGTVNFRINPSDITTVNQKVLRGIGANSNRFYFHVYGTSITIVRGNNTARTINNVFVIPNIDYNITWYWKAAGYILKCWINGVNVYDGTYDGISNGGDGTFQIGPAAGESGFSGIVKDVKIYNRATTTQEIKDYNNQFVKPVLVEDLSDSSADSTTIVPREWQLISGTYKAGEYKIANGDIIPEASRTFDTDGTAWYSILTRCTSTYDSVNKNMVLTGNTINDTVVFGRNSVLTIGKRYRIQFDIKSDISAGHYPNLQIFGNFVGVVNIKKPELTSTFQTAIFEGTTTNGNLIIYACEAASVVGATYTVDNLSCTEIAPLSTIQDGTKYLENVTAGILAIPSKQVFGTWEFDLYKGVEGNTARISFIVNNLPSFLTREYGTTFTSDERIIIEKDGSSSGMLSSSASYITNNTWYRIKITRSNAGVFTVLIKGGAFTPTAGYDGWTLVSVVGGSGFNPTSDITYTTSNYLVLDLDAGDRFANLVIKNGIIIN